VGFVLLGAVWLIHQLDYFQRFFQDSLRPADTKSASRVEVLMKRPNLSLSVLRFHNDGIEPMSRQLLLEGQYVPSDHHGSALEYLSHQGLYGRIICE